MKGYPVGNGRAGEGGIEVDGRGVVGKRGNNGAGGRGERRGRTHALAEIEHLARP